MSEHFIRNIEIKNYKLFTDFKAEGFGRVNLIGGKNNVGKTAFMEACLLGSVKKNSYGYIRSLIIIELNRNPLDFLLNWLNDFESFEFKYTDSFIITNDNFTPVRIKAKNFEGYEQGSKILMYGIKLQEALDMRHVEKCDYRDGLPIFSRNEILDKSILNSLYKKASPPLIRNSKYISLGNNFNDYLVDFIDEIKLAGKEDDLNEALQSFFGIEKIDNIKKKVMLKRDKEYLLLSEFGDGVKHFLNIILALYLNKDSVLYLDEIENGIHYTNLDKLWKIILTISKEQNVQVFATTHSKECIESYARVAKKLENEEIRFIELGRNKNDQIKAIVMDTERFYRDLKAGNEVRGW